MSNELFIMHYGVGHDKGGHSGRYPWGSGKNPYGGKKKLITNGKASARDVLKVKERYFKDSNMAYDPAFSRSKSAYNIHKKLINSGYNMQKNNISMNDPIVRKIVSTESNKYIKEHNKNIKKVETFLKDYDLINIINDGKKIDVKLPLTTKRKMSKMGLAGTRYQPETYSALLDGDVGAEQHKKAYKFISDLRNYTLRMTSSVNNLPDKKEVEETLLDMAINWKNPKM